MAAIDELLALYAYYLLTLVMIRRRGRRQTKEKRKHRFWVRKVFKKREELGVYHTLVQELRLHDREWFYR